VAARRRLRAALRRIAIEHASRGDFATAALARWLGEVAE
jgi:hypothetical protein